MIHPTVSVRDTGDGVGAVVLIGPPASGKTTVRTIMSDYGVLGCDLAPYHEAGVVTDDDWTVEIDELLESASGSSPHVAVVEGAISDEQIEYIRETAGAVLVLLVDSDNFRSRVDRYVERETNTFYDGTDALSEAEVEAFRMDAVRRDYEERPYPQHDARIVNSDEVSIAELTERSANIVAAVSDIDRDDLATPSTVTPE